MKAKMVKRFLGPLVLVLAVAASGAQGASVDKLGVLCEIDLTKIKISNKPPPPSVPKSVFTLNTRKHCPSSTPPNPNQITLECLAKIPTCTPANPTSCWPAGKASNNQNVQCQVNGDACGAPGFFPAGKGTLNIDSSGNARLFCKR